MSSEKKVENLKARRGRGRGRGGVSDFGYVSIQVGLCKCSLCVSLGCDERGKGMSNIEVDKER